MATDTVRHLTVIQAAEHLSLSRSKVYELLADGALPSVRIGRNRHITMTALPDLITQHSEIGINVPYRGNRSARLNNHEPSHRIVWPSVSDASRRLMTQAAATHGALPIASVAAARRMPEPA